MNRSTGASGPIGSIAGTATNSVVSLAWFRYHMAYAIRGYRIGARRVAARGMRRPGTDHRNGIRGDPPRAITPIRGCQV